MSWFPKKRKRLRSGILRSPERIWRRHRRFVTKHECCVPGCQQGQIVFAHVRSSMDGGTSLKPHDWFGISLCWNHHAEQSHIGEPAFERKYGISMIKLAEGFIARSTDQEMREAMKEQAPCT